MGWHNEAQEAMRAGDEMEQGVGKAAEEAT